MAPNRYGELDLGPSYRHEQGEGMTRFTVVYKEVGCQFWDEIEYYWYSFDVQDWFYSWFQLLRDKVHTLVRPNTNNNLPYDIIIDILSRLPAQSLLRLQDISTPLSASFIATHSSRAAPVIAFCYHFTGANLPFQPTCNQHYVNFTDAMGKKTTTSVVFFKKFHPHIRKAVLYGSCTGFLLFVTEHQHVHIWNPVTTQIIRVRTHNPNNRFCGFYFHPASMGYRLLFRHFDKQKVPVSFSFYVYDLVSSSKLKRLVASGVHHPPTIETLPTMVNEALHWMVSDASYKYVYGSRSNCLHSIISFDINSEQFHTTSHPGGQCGLVTKHGNMGLMEMEAKLALCDTSSNKYLDLWILEDYEHKVWIKRHVIEIEPLMRFCGINHDDGSYAYVGDFYTFNKELLLRVGNRELVLYNMESGTFQSVGKSVRKSKDKDLLVLAVPHINTLLKITITSPAISK